MSDLWPDDLDVATIDVQSPLAILKEQASLLGAKTKNIVKARVAKSRDLKSDAELFASRLKEKSPRTAPFRYFFLIHSPVLGEYRYRLFEISFGIEFYPVIFQLDEDIVRELRIDPKEGIIAKDESEFVDMLSRILKSKRTRQVIRAILSQTMEASDSSSSCSE